LLSAALLAPTQLISGPAETAWSSGEFLPGEVWNDTAGSPINAHGGGMLFHEGVYYWYGEAKAGRTFLPDCNKSWGGTRVDLTGVSCYSSTNLYNWKNEGLALAAVPDDPKHDLHSSRVLERPKVIYNHATKQFVMWMHADSADYKAACAGVAVSAKPTGPFKYLSSFRPDAGFWPKNVTEADKLPSRTNALARDFKQGQMARDLTVFVDDDSKAYLFYASEDNATMHVSLLTADYLHTTGEYARILVGRSMEAPAVFKRGGKYYLIASGCTAWAPNAARLSVADSIFGPWTELGNPCVGKDADMTFRCQSTYVLPVAHASGRLIFMADRWKQWDLPDSRYVWLPLEFDAENRPVIRWHDRWSLLETQARAEVPRTQ
jgi:beta-xylosidase